MMEIEELRSIRVDLVAAQTKIDRLLAELEPEVPEEARYVQGLPRTKAIEWILEQIPDKSFRPVEIWAALQLLGRSDPKMEIQVTTFDLWERGRIGKSGRGQYHAKRE